MDAPPQQPTTASLLRRALELGISALGVCPAEPYVGTEAAILERRAAGQFADLKFTMSRPEVSCHPEHAVDGAMSVVSAALCYWRPDDEPVRGATESTVEASTGRIARYTRWDAYSALRSRLDALAAELVAAGHSARVLVDSNDHVDREAAVRSGVGFYGKHTNVISRMHGSWIVLGTIITSAQLVSTEQLRPGCGSCTACIDACPTDAIVEPGVLDTRSCITYWTQSRNEVPESIRAVMGDMVYGCDICQDVCPWNRGVEGRSNMLERVSGSVSLEEWLSAPHDELNERYNRFFIPRRDARFLRRNALIAMGNAARVEDVPILAPWVTSDDAMLRDYAVWALQQIDDDLARAALALRAKG